MNTLIAAAIRCSLMFLVPTATYAISARWDLDPISGDWNTAANWTPDGVPNGAADIATFGLSHTSDVSISANTEVSGITFAAAATNPYTISASFTLTISGTGVTNNSGITQNFVTVAGRELRFTNNATGGSNVSISNEGGDFNETGGTTNFFDHSTAGGSILNSSFSSTNFFDHSNAGTAVIVHDDFGSTNFFNRSSAGNADIETFNTGGSGAFVSFNDNSTAAGAFIGVTDSSRLQFSGNSTAGNATIGSAGLIDFGGSSTAGSAIINSFGVTSFSGASKGGTAQIELGSIPDFNYFGTLDTSGHNAPGLTIGSLADAGGTFDTFVLLGANNLTIGSNNLSTTFSGVIQGSGSLTKIGTGTLNLTGASTYTGNTNVNRGVLQVDGSITSNTFVNHGGTLAGTGTINGNVMNNGKVSPGDSPGMLTVVHNYTQAQYATLMIQIAGMNTGQFSVLNVLGNANLNGFLDPVLLNGFVPTIGDSFTFLNYASLTGGFSNITHQIFDNGMLQWSVIYEANHAILTVEQHIPDQGSTFLLLTLGLLGLVMYQRQLLRGQP